MFKNLESRLTCDKYTISEHDKLPKNLSAEQILIRSSNIGSVRIAQKIGIESGLYDWAMTSPLRKWALGLTGWK